MESRSTRLDWMLRPRMEIHIMKPQAYLALLTMALTLALFSMTIVYAEDAQDDSSTDDILLNLEKIKKAHEYFRSYIDAQSSPQSLLGFQRGYAEKLDILPRELHQRLVEHHRQKVTEEYQGDFSDQLRPTLKGVIETKKQFGNDIRLWTIHASNFSRLKTNI